MTTLINKLYALFGQRSFEFWRQAARAADEPRQLTRDDG